MKSITYPIREMTVYSNGSVMAKIHLKREYCPKFITNLVIKKGGNGRFASKAFWPHAGIVFQTRAITPLKFNRETALTLKNSPFPYFYSPPIQLDGRKETEGRPQSNHNHSNDSFQKPRFKLVVSLTPIKGNGSKPTDYGYFSRAIGNWASISSKLNQKYDQWGKKRRRRRNNSRDNKGMSRQHDQSSMTW